MGKWLTQQMAVKMDVEERGRIHLSFEVIMISIYSKQTRITIHATDGINLYSQSGKPRCVDNVHLYARSPQQLHYATSSHKCQLMKTTGNRRIIKAARPSQGIAKLGLWPANSPRTNEFCTLPFFKILHSPSYAGDLIFKLHLRHRKIRSALEVNRQLGSFIINWQRHTDSKTAPIKLIQF